MPRRQLSSRYDQTGSILAISGDKQVSHLHRVASIVGTLLVGVAAYLIVADRTARARARRHGQPPVEELADELKHAWAGYHNR